MKASDALSKFQMNRKPGRPAGASVKRQGTAGTKTESNREGGRLGGLDRFRHVVAHVSKETSAVKAEPRERKPGLPSFVEQLMRRHT